MTKNNNNNIGRYGRDLNSVLKDNLGDSWEEA